MRKLFIIPLLVLFCLVSLAVSSQSYSWQWAYGIYGGNLSGVTAHPTDGCYLSGAYTDSLIFNRSDFQDSVNLGPSGYLMRLNSFGTAQWI